LPDLPCSNQEDGFGLDLERCATNLLRAAPAGRCNETAVKVCLPHFGMTENPRHAFEVGCTLADGRLVVAFRESGDSPEDCQWKVGEVDE